MSPDTIKAVFVQSLFQPWVAFWVIIPAVFGLGLWLMGTFFAFSALGLGHGHRHHQPASGGTVCLHSP